MAHIHRWFSQLETNLHLWLGFSMAMLVITIWYIVLLMDHTFWESLQDCHHRAKTLLLSSHEIARYCNPVMSVLVHGSSTSISSLQIGEIVPCMSTCALFFFPSSSSSNAASSSSTQSGVAADGEGCADWKWFNMGVVRVHKSPLSNLSMRQSWKIIYQYMEISRIVHGQVRTLWLRYHRGLGGNKNQHV